MRTPLEGLPHELRRLPSRQEIKGIEQSKKAIKKMDKEMIFFLIDPFVKRLSRMG